MDKPLILIPLLCAAIIFTLIVSDHASTADNGSKLVIAYSNNVEAYLEPCG